MEAVVIWSGASRPVAFDVKLVGVPIAIEAPLAATRIAKGLALHNKGRQWGVGCRQQRSMYGSQRFVNKFMREEMCEDYRMIKVWPW